MTLQERKLHLIDQLVRTSDAKFIKQVEALLKESFKAKYEKNLKPMNEKKLLERAYRSEDDIKAGRVLTLKEVKSYYKTKKRK